MSYFLLYLILVLDNVNAGIIPLLVIIPIFIVVIIIIYSCVWTESNEDWSFFGKKITKLLKYLVPVWIFLFLLAIFLPTTKQAATIYLLPQIASNKSMQQLPSKTAELLLGEVKKEIASLNTDNVINSAVKTINKKTR